MGRGTTPPSNQSTFCIYTVDRNSNPFGEQNGVHACIEEMSPITTFFLNIPYGQSSAKLPVIQSSVIWIIRVIWVISSCHPVFPSSCHPVILSSCYPVILLSCHPFTLSSASCHSIILSSSSSSSSSSSGHPCHPCHPVILSFCHSVILSSIHPGFSILVVSFNIATN